MQNKTPNKEHDKIFKIALENRKELVEIINEILRLRGKEKTEEILKNMKEEENMLAVVEMMRKEAEKERKLDFSNGRKTGLKEGRATGLKDGRVLGIKDGIKEGITKIAKKLLKLNYDTNSIKEITGLKEEEIEKLRNVDKK